MKKLTVMTIVLAMLLALATVVCAAEVTAEAGETVAVEFDLEKTIEGGDYTITYPSAVLELKSVTPRNTGTEIETADGTARVLCYNAHTDKVVATFAVKAGVADGTRANVVLEATEFTDLEGNPLEVSGSEATVVVGKTPTDPTPTETTPTETAPTETAPTETAPTETTPTETAPTETTPTETAPTETTPTETTPTETTPTETAPTETTPTEVTPTEKDDKTKFDPTGISVAYVGIIALVVLAGAVVLIKRK